MPVLDEDTDATSSLASVHKSTTALLRRLLQCEDCDISNLFGHGLANSFVPTNAETVSPVPTSVDLCHTNLQTVRQRWDTLRARVSNSWTTCLTKLARVALVERIAMTHMIISRSPQMTRETRSSSLRVKIRFKHNALKSAGRRLESCCGCQAFISPHCAEWIHPVDKWYAGPWFTIGMRRCRPLSLGRSNARLVA